MTRGRWLLVGGVVLVLVAVGVLSMNARAGELVRNAPSWLKAHQPPDGIASNAVEPVPAAWQACARPSPMVASCEGYGAGRRVRKTYADNLAAEPSSLIRASVRASGEVSC